jgi:CheY-like chemotaxis protein
MTKSFAEESGGGMTVESTPGCGTTVTLWLPAADAGAKPAPMPAPMSAPGDAPSAPGPASAAAAAGATVPPPQVLLVDDDEPVRETLALLLEDAGYRVLQAADGCKALALLAAGQTVDALVTDLSMPGLDGLAVIRAARARCPGLPAVLLTGSADDTGPMVDENGADTHALLRKPATGPQLTECLDALLGGRAGADRVAGSMDDP